MNYQAMNSMANPFLTMGYDFSNNNLPLSNLFYSILQYEKFMNMISLNNQLFLNDFSTANHQLKEKINTLEHPQNPCAKQSNDVIDKFIPHKSEEPPKKKRFMTIKTIRSDLNKRRVIKNNKIVFSHGLTHTQKKKLISGIVN